jgi:fatty acid desaturase
MEIDALAPRGLDRETVLGLSRRSNAPGLMQLALHLAVLTTTGALIQATRSGWWLAPAILLHGIALDFLFCALHESIHRTAFASRWLNDTVAWIVGALLVLPADYFRLFHFAHHRFTQDPLRDPELITRKPASRAAYAWFVSGLPNWRARLKGTLRHALTGRVREPFIPSSQHRDIVREARLVWAFYAAVLLLSLALRRSDALLFWVLPAIAGQPFLRLFLHAEHTGCAQSDDMFANTRTTYTNALVRRLTWDMPYHVEHHAYPSVPFHALCQVNRLIRDRIQVRAPGYVAVHRGLLRPLPWVERILH